MLTTSETIKQTSLSYIRGAMAVPPEVLAAATEEALATGGPNEQTTRLPVPPYTAADKAEDGLQCFYEGCPFMTYKYGNLLDHCRNKHGRKFSELNGTYLHTMGLQDKLLQQAKYRTRKATTAAGASSDHKQVAKKAETNNNDEKQVDTELGTQWLAVKCWVKYSSDGEAIQPYIYGGPCSCTPYPGKSISTGSLQAGLALS